MIRTKIIATVGPASESPERIGNLIDAGVDVFRLNFSHGALDWHGRTLENIRSVSIERGATTAVLADLCGPKIRVDPLEAGAIEIAAGDEIDLVSESVRGNARRISTSRAELVHEVAVGDRVLIDDGSVRLRVREALGDRLRLVCEVGGSIGTRKGVNLPDSTLQMPALTEEDRRNLAWALERGVEYVALSFVRNAADILALRSLLPLSEDACEIVAKIETPQAVADLDAIIEATDVVLVARGDLGVEMELAQVPIVQKEIARKCQQAGKPVIIATQMLQSMVDQPTATRAEVSDVANAILDSADCVMLSAETSVGAYPAQSVAMMNRIAERTEAYLDASGFAPRMEVASTMRRVTTAVAHGASLLARELDAKLVAVWTETGKTARLLSKCRLDRPVIGLSPDEHVCRRMALYYGVVPVHLSHTNDVPAMLREVDRMLLDRQLAVESNMVVVVAGTRLEKPGATNSLLIHLVKDQRE